jgi:putative hydrolase
MTDPFSGGFDPRMFEQIPLFRELAKVMSWTGGPVNWDLARQTAEALAGSAPSDASDADFADAVRVAEMWLDGVTALPAVEGSERALTPREWVQLASDPQGLGLYMEPVATGMNEALTRQMPEELSGMMGGQLGPGGPMGQALGSVGAMMYGIQTGTIAGNLAGQMLGCYDLAVPTVEPTVIGPVGDALRRFAADYGFDETELRYWLALREAMHRRMFAGVRWLRPRLSELVERFAAGADFDPGAMMEAIGGMGLDPSDPAAIQEALDDPQAFRIEPTPAQREVLGQLQGLVAFTEGYGATVLRRAAGERLGSLGRIEEAMLRRRAEQGPGERFLENLVGLDLKPRDLRQGQEFCDAVIAARGQEGLDRAWQRPENLPTAAELAEPSRWLVRMAAVELEQGAVPPLPDKDLPDDGPGDDPGDAS